MFLDRDSVCSEDWWPLRCDAYIRIHSVCVMFVCVYSNSCFLHETKEKEVGVDCSFMSFVNDTIGNFSCLDHE